MRFIALILSLLAAGCATTGKNLQPMPPMPERTAARSLAMEPEAATVVYSVPTLVISWEHVDPAASLRIYTNGAPYPISAFRLMVTTTNNPVGIPVDQAKLFFAFKAWKLGVESGWATNVVTEK